MAQNLLLFKRLHRGTRIKEGGRENQRGKRENVDGEGRGKGRGRVTGRAGVGRAEEKSCLILDQEVDQVVKAARRHEYVVRIIDRWITRLQGGHRAHRQ